MSRLRSAAAFVLGSHLGFVAGMKKEMAAAMIIGKLAGGVTAAAAAAWMTPAQSAKQQKRISAGHI
nr:ethanolamine utilization protein EutH [Bacillus subtilis]